MDSRSLRSCKDFLTAFKASNGPMQNRDAATATATSSDGVRTHILRTVIKDLHGMFSCGINDILTRFLVLSSADTPAGLFSSS